METVTYSNLKTSLASLIIGSLAATALSGVVTMQGIIYFRMFEGDGKGVKLIVFSIIVLDVLHSAMLWTADYGYFVTGFGNTNITDHVFWSVGVSIALTAITTVIVHLSFIYRLFRFSKGNYFICVPMAIIALCRVGSACTTAGEIIRLESFHAFYRHYRWLFTLGLTLSTALDIMITSGLCIFLRRSRSTGNGNSGRLDHILDSMTLYTVETGLVTCIATAVSLILWLAKPHALVYLGLHFAISKLYANSFLASMNARKLLRAQYASQSTTSGSGAVPPVFTNRHTRNSAQHDTLDLTGPKVQIAVDKMVEYDTDTIPMDTTRPSIQAW
ncbi:hypothetical protein FOMPIDRAFT_1026104 [Fomitopsis schrenkii]|uniref:DUF6534 domain-containing protein n=1 Tax=Fomitopsis schrenkii TaxID=2126942 RepID=S8EYV8_FOMSC|nr:hypothetical protein FOMPIDRAFT_1026104 [Fomitopsis schrenkii]